MEIIKKELIMLTKEEAEALDLVIKTLENLSPQLTRPAIKRYVSNSLFYLNNVCEYLVNEDEDCDYEEDGY